MLFSLKNSHERPNREDELGKGSMRSKEKINVPMPLSHSHASTAQSHESLIGMVRVERAFE